MKRQEALHLLSAIARQQGRYFTRAQALTRQIDNAQLIRLVRDGTLDKPTPGVYRFSGAPLMDMANMWEIWLSMDPLGSGSLAYCCLGAVFYHGLGNAMPGRFSVAPTGRGYIRECRHPIRVHKHACVPDDVTVYHGLRVVKPFAALKACVEGTMDADQLQEAIDDGLDRHLLTEIEVSQLWYCYEQAV